MLDTLQIDGLLGRYTLRHWSVAGAVDRRVRLRDEHEVLELLRRPFDAEAVRRLRSFMVQVGFELHVCASDPEVLLARVARRIAVGELVLEYEAIAPMPSEVVEVVEPADFEPLVNEIDEGVGLRVLSPDEPRLVNQALLACQAKQAQTLRAASATAQPFCEACAESPTIAAAPPPPPSELVRQANQAQTLRSAAVDGAPFCERCNC
jgi:hypothetical protein